MDTEKNIEFSFKGNRKYIHGTDIFNKVIHLLKDHFVKNKFDLSFHGIANKNIKVIQNKPSDDALIKFVCKYTTKTNERKILYGIENAEEIKDQYEYPEENISKLAKINLERKMIRLESNSSFSFIENAVALNKYLLENLFPNINGKWYFTRLQLNELSSNNDYPLEITLKANFNFKLTKSEIFIGDQSIGFIYFSLV